MPPSFLNLKELRRRSKANFRTDRSTDESSESSHNTTPTSGSTFTDGSPPTSASPSIATQSDSALNLQSQDQPHPLQPAAVPRPHPRPNGGSNRHSVSGMVGLGSPVPEGRGPVLPISLFSPRITNVSDGQWVHQKILIAQGTIGDDPRRFIDGIVRVSRLDDSFPPISWPACDSRFKALVYLMPGPNRLRFDFCSPKLANSESSNPIHTTYLTVNMLPPVGAPPLQLAILMAKDSPGTFDAIPARIEREGNGLEMAIRKFRMAAYLWQAFTSENMWRNKLGRRVFRFEEEWTAGTANDRDSEDGTLRSEARIHIIRTEKTVAELRDLSLAQQNPGATDPEGLYRITADAVRDYFKPPPGQKLYVSVLLLDAHWDKESKTIVGHAAIGRQDGNLNLGIFGSHCLQSYPASFEDVVPAFTDCTPTDTNHAANDHNEAGSSWEAANVGIGGHLYVTGRLLGLPLRESGIMQRDYLTISRSFLTREAFSTRTRCRGGPVTQEEECAFHRLDYLHFRSHPCFRIPNDPVLHKDINVQGWPTEGGNLRVTAATGIAYVEVFAEHDTVCHSWFELPPDKGGMPPRLVALNQQELRGRLAEEKRKGRLSVKVKSCGGGSLDIDDWDMLCSKEAACLKIPSAVPGLSKTALRGRTVGLDADAASKLDVIFSSSLAVDRVLSRVVVYHGETVGGLEFVYDDESRQLFGKKGEEEEAGVFELDVRRGESITGFFVRSSSCINAIQILTSMGRKSPLFGNVLVGEPHTLIPPRGYNVCGVTGSCGAGLDRFSCIITK